MASNLRLPAAYREALDRTVEALERALGENLSSLVLYGSAVRGNLVGKVSDLNLLVVLKASTPDAHAAIADAIHNRVRIEPMVVSAQEIDRTVEAFATKFRSISRHYTVLHGADPLSDLRPDLNVVRFLSEQALRNLKLRAVRGFVVFGSEPRRYRSFLLNIVPNVFTELAEALRLEGKEVPHDFAERIPLFEEAYGVDGGVLRDLLGLKQQRRGLYQKDVFDIHRRLFALLDGAVAWIASRWPKANLMR